VGSRCRECGASSWPGRSVCHRCGSFDVDGWALPAEGTLTSITTVRVPKPRLESPYTIGEIELAEGLRIYAHVRGVEAVSLPSTVRLVVAPEPDAPVAFWFAAA
jgi:uncharacterized OB-fold protein